MKLSYRLLTTLLVFTLAATAHAQNLPVMTQTAPAGTATTTLTLPPDITVPGSKHNYVRSIVPRKAISNPSLLTKSTPAEDAVVSTEYKDGFNRTMQVVTLNANIDGQKLVQPADTRFQKDEFGFLPFPSYTSGDFRPDAFTAERAFYNGLYGGEDATAYSKTVLLSNATQRSTIGYSPGKSQVGQNRGVTTTFIACDANEVRNWIVSAGKPVGSSYYAANSLAGEQTTDITGAKVRIFKDRNGNIIYKAVWADATTPLITQYVYDNNGRLTFIITPRALAIASTTATSLADDVRDNLCFQYQYDANGRLIAERKPGEGSYTEIVYDRKERVVMRRSPLEKQLGKWEITFYDKSGRVIATSLYNSTATQATWQANIDALSPATTFVATNILHYMATTGGEGKYPAIISGNEVMSYSYYDHYNHAGVTMFSQVFDPSSFAEAPIGAESPAMSLRTQGMVTGSRVRVIKGAIGTELSDWVETVNYYDEKGRVIQQRSRNATKSGTTAGQEITSTYYDFNGKPLLTSHYHENKKTGHAANEHTKFIYHAETGKLLQTAHKVNEDVWQLINGYSYDQLNRVSRKVLGNYAEVQDYTYNIRGQLTGINAAYTETGNKGGESRSFGELLRYDYGFSDARYDGKPTGMLWRAAGGTLMAYGYSYDLSGRLKQAEFRRLEGSTWSKAGVDYTVNHVTYDENGNILSLKQRAPVDVGGYIVPGDMDKLNYVYEANSNRLTRIEDTVTFNWGYGDFVNGNVGTVDYGYDSSGNITKDLNKGITAITYTHFNKPQLITFSNGNTIQYIYDAAGNKLQELVTISGSPKRTDYVGNFVYENDVLQYITTADGRTVYTPADGKYKEEFFVKDHLGNVRTVVEVETFVMSEYLASYEVASAGLEGLMFDKVSEIAEDNPIPDPGNTQSGLLNGAIANRRIGTSLLLRVMAGDKVEMNVNSFYESYNPGTDAPVNAATMLSSIVSTLTTGTGGLGGSESHNPQLVGQLFNSNNYTPFANMVNISTDVGKPRAYLNYILFNEQMQMVGSFSGAYQANGLGTWSELGTTEPMEIPQNGFLAVYLSDASTQPVYFDQLVIRFTRGKLLEETHYYPHGLPMAMAGSAASGMKPNRVKHQGNEYIKDAGLHWMDFKARQYDPQLGRFLGVDPLAASGGQDRYSPYAAMGNQPESMVDPNGLAYTASSSSHNLWGNQLGYRNASMGAMPTGLDYMRDNFGVGGQFMKSMAEYSENFRMQLVGDAINEMLGEHGYTSVGDGAYAYNSLGASSSPSDGDQVLTSHTNSDRQFVYDKPSGGLVSLAGYTYDLNAFEKFYDTYGNKFPVKQTIQGFDIDENTEVLKDMKPGKMYAEAGAFLVLNGNTITTGLNRDPKRKGTSNKFDRVYEGNMFVPAGALSISIHTHPSGKYHALTPVGGYIPINTTRGPSDHDFVPSYSNSKMRNVIVDQNYIYLVYKKDYQTVTIKR